MAAHDATPPTDSLAATRPPVALECGATSVVFTWRHDRWWHCCSPATDDASSRDSPATGAAWQSLDGPWPAEDDPRWPASPVLVELSLIDRRGDGRAILGVGMAGRSHFSASVAVDPSAADAVRFEIACRLHDGPGWLGSTYRQGGRLVRIAAHTAAGQLPRTVQWSYSIGRDGIFGVRGATVSTRRE